MKYRIKVIRICINILLRVFIINIIITIIIRHSFIALHSETRVVNFSFYYNDDMNIPPIHQSFFQNHQHLLLLKLLYLVNFSSRNKFSNSFKGYS